MKATHSHWDAAPLNPRTTDRAKLPPHIRPSHATFLTMHAQEFIIRLHLALSDDTGVRTLSHSRANRTD